MSWSKIDISLQKPGYIRLFQDKQVQQVANIEISDYLPFLMKNFIYNNPSDSLYILCPYYKGHDIQIAMTGGLLKDEMYIDAAKRELGEELGVVPKNILSLSNVSAGFKNDKLSDKIVIYTANIKNMNHVDKSQHGVDFSKGRADDRSRGIGCIVYGTMEELLEFISEPDKIYRYYSKDNIIGIAMISVSDACSFIEVNLQ